MKPKIPKDERGVAFILEIIVICLVLAVVGVVGYKIYQKHGGSLFGPAPITQNPKNLAQAHNALGFNVVRDLNHEQKDNVFISPTSIALALSMVYNGANGDTKQAMASTLQFKNLDTSQINQESLGLINLLKNPDKDVELSIANSIWTHQGLDVKPEFLKSVSDYYQAKSTALDFNDPGAAKEINSWVDKNTKGKIPTIVDSIPSDMVMYLINATYFKGTWTKSFDKSQTVDKAFVPSKGASYKVPMMYQHEDDFSYYETDDFQSVSLPYGKSKRLSMYVFLPKDLEKFTDSLDIQKWELWMSKYKESKGTVLLPRFKMEYEKELKDTLTKLGMGVAFDSQADFTGIGDSLQISQVKHKTFLDVNEEGTEAAAVTSVGAVTTSIGGPEEKEFYMEVNQPFFLAIKDNQTKEILFAGAINHP